MSHTVQSLAEHVEGDIQGAADKVITDAAALEAAGLNAISFVQDEKNFSRLKNCQAGAILLTASAAAMAVRQETCTWIIVPKPQLAFQKLLPLFRRVPLRPPRGISPHAFISPTAKLGPNCSVGPGVFIDDHAVIGADCDLHHGAHVGAHCRLGSQVTLYPQAVLYHGVELGDRVIIHAHAVIGADGFGYRYEAGRFLKIPQLGHVRIDADAEIGACATIDRGAIGPTVIGEGTKIDNLVMIAHNCELGKHNVFASQVGLAGSCTTGDHVRLGGQVGVKDHVRLNSGCSVGAKGGVHKDVPEGEVWVGYLATQEHEQKRLVFSLKRVPEMREQLRDLERQIANLTAAVAKLTADDESSNTPQLRAAG